MRTPSTPEITSASIQALVDFLPLLESADFSPGELKTPEGQLPYFAYSKQVDAFISALYKHGWILGSDWSAWQEQAEAYVRDPDSLKNASAETLRKLLTTHARKDRFCDGHLAVMFQNGHLVAVLRRLKDILSQES
jgi:hypothetical protein